MTQAGLGYDVTRKSTVTLWTSGFEPKTFRLGRQTPELTAILPHPSNQLKLSDELRCPSNITLQYRLKVQIRKLYYE